MPYRESNFTASKRIAGDNNWFVRCTIHGEFENNTGRCLKCDEDGANYVGEEDD